MGGREVLLPKLLCYKDIPAASDQSKEFSLDLASVSQEMEREANVLRRAEASRKFDAVHRAEPSSGTDDSSKRSGSEALSDVDVVNELSDVVIHSLEPVVSPLNGTMIELTG